MRVLSSLRKQGKRVGRVTTVTKRSLLWLRDNGRSEVRLILHLPFLKRLFHPASRRALRALGLSAIIMICGSLIADSAGWLSAVMPINHILIDALGYLAHGIGAVPIVKYAEPIWAIIMGE